MPTIPTQKFTDQIRESVQKLEQSGVGAQEIGEILETFKDNLTTAFVISRNPDPDSPAVTEALSKVSKRALERIVDNLDQDPATILRQDAIAKFDAELENRGLNPSNLSRMANQQEYYLETGKHKSPEQKLINAISTACQEQEQKIDKEAQQPSQQAAQASVKTPPAGGHFR